MSDPLDGMPAWLADINMRSALWPRIREGQADPISEREVLLARHLQAMLASPSSARQPAASPPAAHHTTTTTGHACELAAHLGRAASDE